ncbi:MAG: TonB-dependent receptor [Deltaproteobacteria bacterium]|nr:MAG: TonB-dependent receptor [Deltaproteobacteria bacterium]
MNPDSAQTVAVINAEKAAQTPIFHQVEGMAQQVAGVGPGNRPSTRGGLARHGKFYVDGLDTTDITDGSITAPMNFDAVENFEIITGGFDAQYNSMGMITNAVTKNGGNQFKVDTSVTVSPNFMFGQNNFPATQPGFYGNYVDNPNPAPNHLFFSPIFNMGGPIVKDKLWFYASYQQNFNDAQNPISIYGLRSKRPVDTTTSLGRVKLTWQATEKDRLTLGFNLDRNVINNAFGDSSVTDDAESKIHRGGEFVLLNYDHNFSDSVLFTLQTGVTYKQVNQDPIHDDFTTPAHFDIGGGVGDRNSDRISSIFHGNYLHETKYRIQFDPMLSWKMKGLGTHQFKAGVQYSWLIDRQATGEAGNQNFTDSGGLCKAPADPSLPADPSTFQYCFKRTQFQGNQGGSLVTRATASDIGLFIQDRWNVNRQLTIIPGFRIDAGILYGDPYANTDGSQNAPKFTNLAGIGPRLSATYDLFGDRRTLIVANYGRNNDLGNVFIAQHGNPALTEYSGTWSTSGKAFPDCQSNPALPTCTVVGGPGGRSTPYHSLTSPMKPPHVDELLFGVHHEVVPETAIGVDFDYRRYGNMWEDIEVNRIWDASGTKIIGYQDPNNVGRSVVVSTTANEAYRKYASMDLWVQGTPGRWDLLASYTLAYNWGTVSDYFDGYLLNPRMTQFYEGWVPDDRRHTLKGSIAYRTLFGLDLGARVQYRTGSPMWEHSSNPADTNQSIYHSPRGTGVPFSSLTGAQDFNDPTQWTELRNPDQFNIDLQARYNLGGALKMKEQKLDVVLLVVNVLSSAAAQTLTDTVKSKNNAFGDATGFGHFAPIQGELLIRYRN